VKSFYINNLFPQAYNQKKSDFQDEERHKKFFRVFHHILKVKNYKTATA